MSGESTEPSQEPGPWERLSKASNPTPMLLLLGWTEDLVVGYAQVIAPDSSMIADFNDACLELDKMPIPLADKVFVVKGKHACIQISEYMKSSSG